VVSRCLYSCTRQNSLQLQLSALDLMNAALEYALRGWRWIGVRFVRRKRQNSTRASDVTNQPFQPGQARCQLIPHCTTYVLGA